VAVTPDPGKHGVLVSNLRYTGEGTEPEYVWVEEERIRTTLTTLLFGKSVIIAPPNVVPRWAPATGDGRSGGTSLKTSLPHQGTRREARRYPWVNR
jgi:hypothetical protein